MIIGSEFWKISIDNTDRSWDGFYCFRHEAIMEGKAKFHNGDFYILKCKYKNVNLKIDFICKSIM
jgi:hypothetical protein